MPRVLNKYRDQIPPSAVYCGRGSPYGNPFVIAGRMTRKRAIEKFVCEVLPTLDCEPLRGKDLVCFCKPKPCHVDWVLEKANKPAI